MPAFPSGEDQTVDLQIASICPRDAHQCVYLSTPWEVASRRLIKHPCELGAWERLLKCPFQPGAWNKRSREQRPLTGVGKLAVRERVGDGDALQCRTSLALGTQRPLTPVKGEVAHATGGQKRHGGAGQSFLGLKRVKLPLSQGGRTRAYPDGISP